MKKIITNIILILLSSAAIADSNVNRAQITSNVIDREPVDIITQTSTSPIYFFTDIRNCKQCNVEHQWLFNGDHKFVLVVVPSSNRYRWWSKITPGSTSGMWTARIRINGKVIEEKSVKYVSTTGTTQQRLQNSLESQCEEKLMYFRSQSTEHPDDPYYKFMFNKWGKRCIN